MGKYRGQIRITMEQVQRMLELPSEVELLDVYMDASREIVHFKIRSEEPVTHLTYATGEGMEILNVNLNHYLEKKADKDA